jgi:hypothetical protein
MSDPSPSSRPLERDPWEAVVRAELVNLRRRARFARARTGPTSGVRDDDHRPLRSEVSHRRVAMTQDLRRPGGAERPG